MEHWGGRELRLQLLRLGLHHSWVRWRSWKEQYVGRAVEMDGPQRKIRTKNLNHEIVTDSLVAVVMRMVAGNLEGITHGS